jgi:hypothetical protein
VDFPEAEALKLLDKAGDKVRAITPVIRSGDLIEWHRAGTVQHGTVDFLHDDTDGMRWVFVTLADQSWAAVNLKFTTVRTDATLLSTDVTPPRGGLA